MPTRLRTRPAAPLRTRAHEAALAASRVRLAPHACDGPPPIALALTHCALGPLRDLRLGVHPREVALVLATGRQAIVAVDALLALACGACPPAAGDVRWPLAPPPRCALDAAALRPRVHERPPAGGDPLLVVNLGTDPGASLAALLRLATGGCAVLAVARIGVLAPTVSRLTLGATTLLRAFVPSGAAAPHLTLYALAEGRLRVLLRVARRSVDGSVALPPGPS